MDPSRLTPKNLFSYRNNNNSSEQTVAPAEQDTPTPLTEIIKPVIPVLGKNRELANRLKTRSTPRPKGNSEARQKMSSHRQVKIDSTNHRGSESADDSTTSSESMTKPDTEEFPPGPSAAAPVKQRDNEPPIDDLENKLTALLDKVQSFDVNATIKRDAYSQQKRQAFNVPNVVTAAKQRDARLQLIRANLPVGAQMDDNGNLSGTGYLTQVPGGVKGVPVELVGSNLVEYMQGSLSLSLNKTTLPQSPNEAAKSRITLQALSDFPRNDIEFTQDDGSTFNSLLSGDSEKTRINRTTDALFCFTGFSENSTIVLSSILTQVVPTNFYRFLGNSEGAANQSLKMVSAMNSQGTPKILIKRDGTEQLISNPRGLGAAKFRLSKEGENFKMSFDWTCYYQANKDKESMLPLGENEVVSIRTRAEFIVDGKAADDGKLAFTIPEGIQTTFEGRLRVG